MSDRNLQVLWERYQAGEFSALEFGQWVLDSAIASDGNLTPDLDRLRRTGYPEVVYGQGKSSESIQRVVERLLGGQRKFWSRGSVLSKSGCCPNRLLGLGGAMLLERCVYIAVACLRIRKMFAARI